LWMCPPAKLLLRVASEIRRREGCEGVLVIPDWPTSNFYGTFFNEDSNARWPFELKESFNPYIYQNQGAKGALNGKVNFKFHVLYFNRQTE
jgi:hypothetical protein